MEFGFSEAQRDVQALARRILGDQAGPETLAAYDEYRSERHDEALWRQVAGAGLVGLALEERYGGTGLGLMELALFIEETGRTLAPLPAISHCVSAALPIQRFASQPLRDSLLPAAAAGEIILSAALAEPLNEDPVNPQTVSARAEGEELVLTGRKVCVPFANRAQRILLAARSGREIAVLLLDPNAPGVTLVPMQVTSFEPQFEMVLDAVRVAPGDVICRRGGEGIMQWTTERTMAALCAHQLGVTDHAMRMAASYTGERRQFDVPISTFQAVGHRMADCYIDVECLRLATWQAVSLLAAEAPATTEVQIAKIWAGDVGHRVSYATQHVHGGMGIDRDYPLWRYCLWMRHNEMTLGSSARHTALLGARLAEGEALFG
ncbi:MAG: acyl-CoA/acyl-ACP dehydrogenase [Halioglobus sp.]|jgi:3-oxocholest-4-en-26-oyl-CoA dehydrogenase beta subunit